MRILLWHGYLLGGTGSNVYTRALAREWSLAGHEVTVVCQERHPERYDLGGAGVVVPELPGRLLPVFVLDRYEGLEARLLGDLSTQEHDLRPPRDVPSFVRVVVTGRVQVRRAEIESEGVRVHAESAERIDDPGDEVGIRHRQ